MPTTRFILLGFCLVWASIAQAETGTDWLTTQWEVFCTTAAENELPTDDCDDLQFSVSDDGPHVTPASRIREDLDDMSKWLQGLGFSGPKIPSNTDNGSTFYQAWIGTDTDHSSGTAWYDGTNLHIKPGYFFAMGETETAAAENVFRIGAPIHELFHAIQMADVPAITLDPKYAWITEGMAQSVLYEWLHKAGIAEADFKYPSREHRYYDIALHQPRCDTVNGERRLGCYATHYFWTWTGRHIGSRDNIQYLQALLKQDLSADYGLAGVDAGLRQFDPKGLYNLYPEFIAKFADNERHFESIEQQQLAYDPQQETTATVQARVEPVAARALRVEALIPANEAASLKIGLVGDHKDLHLIVDDKRLDRGKSERNEFRTALQTGPHTFFVRVANVGRNAADTKASDFTLELSLDPKPTCTFQAQIDARGHSTTVAGTAGLFVDKLSLYSDDWRLTVDISDLTLGAGPGKFTSGDAHTSFRVELDIEKNNDPGNVQGWKDNKLTMREILDSGLSLPDRRDMLRLAGQFKAQHINPDGSITNVHGHFDAGDQAYFCEGGLEAQKQGYQQLLDYFN